MFASGVYSQQAKKIKIEQLTDYIKKADHPLVVNFWATWCTPCNHELPYFERHIKEHAADKVELVLVSMDFSEDYPKKVTDYVRIHKYEGNHFWLNESNADHYCPQIDKKWEGTIPATLFINNKKDYRKFFDRQLTEEQFVSELKSIVNSE